MLPLNAPVNAACFTPGSFGCRRQNRGKWSHLDTDASDAGSSDTASRATAEVAAHGFLHGLRPGGVFDQVFAILEGYGYEVWMSHTGTVPTNPKKTAFSNCLEAVNACDAFLGIITGSYGSGVGPNQRLITHREVVRAVSQRRSRAGSWCIMMWSSPGNS